MELTFEHALDFLVESIKADYLDHTLRGKDHVLRGRENDKRERNLEGLTEVNKKMIAEFNEGISIEPGRKYIKIVKGNYEGGQRMVWGFVVAKDGGKFPKGTILKAAGWNAPATNHGRGNVLGGGYTIQWTGPLYI